MPHPPNATAPAPGITLTELPDGSVYLDAREDAGAGCDYSAMLAIPAVDRAAVAAAILPAPPADGSFIRSTDGSGWVRASMFDSAFADPGIDLITGRDGRVTTLTPDAAEQLAAQLLEKVAAARQRLAEIEGRA